MYFFVRNSFLFLTASTFVLRLPILNFDLAREWAELCLSVFQSRYLLAFSFSMYGWMCRSSLRAFGCVKLDCSMRVCIIWLESELVPQLITTIIVAKLKFLSVIFVLCLLRTHATLSLSFSLARMLPKRWDWQRKKTGSLASADENFFVVVVVDRIAIQFLQKFRNEHIRLRSSRLVRSRRGRTRPNTGLQN